MLKMIAWTVLAVLIASGVGAVLYSNSFGYSLTRAQKWWWCAIVVLGVPVVVLTVLVVGFDWDWLVE